MSWNYEGEEEQETRERGGFLTSRLAEFLSKYSPTIFAGIQPSEIKILSYFWDGFKFEVQNVRGRESIFIVKKVYRLIFLVATLLFLLLNSIVLVHIHAQQLPIDGCHF